MLNTTNQNRVHYIMTWLRGSWMYTNQISWLRDAESCHYKRRYRTTKRETKRVKEDRKPSGETLTICFCAWHVICYLLKIDSYRLSLMYTELKSIELLIFCFKCYKCSPTIIYNVNFSCNVMILFIITQKENCAFVCIFSSYTYYAVSEAFTIISGP